MRTPSSPRRGLVALAALAALAALPALTGAQGADLGGWVLRQQVIPAAGYGAQPDNYFGRAVSVSGAKAVVGSPNLEEGIGLAYVFDLQGAIWSEVAVLASPLAQDEDDFGLAVSTWYGTVLVGAPGEDLDAGSVHVFDAQTGSWQNVARILAPTPAPGQRFGRAVALSRDTAAIGAPGVEAVHIYQWQDDVWTHLSTVAPSSPAAGFGEALAFDGTTLVVGAPGSSRSFVFADLGGGQWVETQELAPAAGVASENFGHAVALASPTIFVGAPDDEGAGSVHVFAFDGATWSSSGALLPGATAPDNDFGEAVSIEGTLGVVGAPGDDAIYGTVHVYRNGPGGWLEEAQLEPEPGDPEAEGNFGRYVAVYGGLVHSNFGLEDSPVIPGYAGSVTVWGPLSAATEVTVAAGLTSSGDGGSFAFEVDRAFANSPYVVLGSAAGTWPGFDLGDVHVQLELDAYTQWTASPTSPLAGGFGVFDDAGRASAALLVPPGAELALQGLTFAHAIVVLDERTGEPVASGEPLILSF